MAKQQHHHIRLSVEICSDLAWWKLFAASWNGTGLVIQPNSTTYVITSDGAWFDNNWFLYHGNEATAPCISQLKNWYQ